jgi:hypothetical protein
MALVEKRLGRAALAIAAAQEDAIQIGGRRAFDAAVHVVAERRDDDDVLDLDSFGKTVTIGPLGWRSSRSPTKEVITSASCAESVSLPSLFWPVPVLLAFHILVAYYF